MGNHIRVLRPLTLVLALAVLGLSATVSVASSDKDIRKAARLFQKGEVVAPEAITKVPAQPAHVLGVSLVHGRLVPVVDISRMLPKKEVSLSNSTGRRLAVVTHGEAEIGSTRCTE